MGIGSLRKPPNRILAVISVVRILALCISCHSTNIDVFQNEICRDTVFPASDTVLVI